MAYVSANPNYVDYAYQAQVQRAQAAKDAAKLADATASGTAAGTALKAAATASGVSLTPNTSSSSSSSGNTGITKVAPLGSGGGSIGGLQAAVGGSGGGAGGGVAPIDTSAKNAAIFGAAKDQAGQTARASITGLRDELAGRGMLGSGAEVAGTEDAIMKAQAGINSVTRQSAVTDADTAQQNAQINYQGGITERGQDIQAQQNATSAALQGRAQDITMRGQDISSQQAAVAQQQQSLSALLSAVGTLY